MGWAVFKLKRPFEAGIFSPNQIPSFSGEQSGSAFLDYKMPARTAVLSTRCPLAGVDTHFRKKQDSADVYNQISAETHSSTMQINQ